MLLQRKRFDRLRRMALAALLLAAVGHALACDVLRPRPKKIAGTDWIEPGDSNTPWFTVSPDEEWIAFMEVDSAYRDPEKYTLPRRGFHLVTMNLATGVKTHHDLDSLSNETFPSDWNDSEWGRWTVIQENLEVPCWLNGELFVCIRWKAPRSPWVAFTPGVPAAVRATPNGELRCSDCPAPSATLEMKKSRGLDVSDDAHVSVAHREGKFSQWTYVYPMGKSHRGAVIERVALGASERVAAKRGRWPFDVGISMLRVSPDERRLAYVADYYMDLNPFHHDELYVRDLEKRRERRVHGHFLQQSSIGNLIWSEDSNRLYFASTGFLGRGIFRLEVSR